VGDTGGVTSTRSAPHADEADTPLSRRAELRQATYAKIKELAREQLAHHGPGGLSLRAIARQMRMASSAMYRYYASINDLTTELIIDAYDSLATTLTTAVAAHPADDPTSQWWALCHAYRDWALEHRSDFALIFGTPLPGYQAPEHATAQAAGRATGLALTLYAQAVTAGAADPNRTQVPNTLQVGPLLPALLADTAPDCPPRLAGITLTAYATMLGYLNTEIFGSLTRLVDTTQLYNAHVRTLMLGMGFDPTQIDITDPGHQTETNQMQPGGKP
jgi:AcrR family transcriptional regulator